MVNLPLQGYNSIFRGYNPSYPFIRSFMGVITPFITRLVGTHLVKLNMHIFKNYHISHGVPFPEAGCCFTENKPKCLSKFEGEFSGRTHENYEFLR